MEPLAILREGAPTPTICGHESAGGGGAAFAAAAPYGSSSSASGGAGGTFVDTFWDLLIARLGPGSFLPTIKGMGDGSAAGWHGAPRLAAADSTFAMAPEPYDDMPGAAAASQASSSSSSSSSSFAPFQYAGQPSHGSAFGQPTAPPFQPMASSLSFAAPFPSLSGNAFPSFPSTTAFGAAPQAHASAASGGAFQQQQQQHVREEESMAGGRSSTFNGASSSSSSAGGFAMPLTVVASPPPQAFMSSSSAFGSLRMHASGGGSRAAGSGSAAAAPPPTFAYSGGAVTRPASCIAVRALDAFVEQWNVRAGGAGGRGGVQSAASLWSGGGFASSPGSRLRSFLSSLGSSAAADDDA